ncbi:MAG: hypothetical protein AAB251_00875 [Deltaproteobacteria bacterium]
MLKKPVVISIIFAVMLAITVSGCGQQLKQENEQLKNQVQTLGDENNNLKSQVESLMKERDDIRAQIASLTQERDNLKKGIEAAKAKTAVKAPAKKKKSTKKTK